MQINELQWPYWPYIALAGLIAVLGLLVYIYYLRKQLDKVRNAKIKPPSGEDLKQILNSYDNQRIVKLKKSGRDTAKRFDLVSVLFSDIQGFTKIAEQLNPEALIDELDDFFFHFDTVVDKYNIEKIKTIGDAYMCAGGIPNENRTNPIEIVLAALDMQLFMRQMKHQRSEMWDLRIGIHTGSVIAGVVGHKKISYDIWGDTVNTASRMESSCTPGRINISGITYDYIKEYFICDYRGKMPVKYKGNIDMYYVKGIKPELDIKIKDLPATHFDIKLQLLRIYDLERYILLQFEKYENPSLTYHNLKNTVDLYTITELFARSENIDEKNMLILLTAALFKNTGYLISYENHLEETLKLAKEILPRFNYVKTQIDQVCGLLSKIENSLPANSIEEKAFEDAVYSYVGRVDFEDVITDMYNEAKSFGEMDFKSWKASQLRILKDYDFHTRAASALREVPKQKQIEKFYKINL